MYEDPMGSLWTSYMGPVEDLERVGGALGDYGGPGWGLWGTLLRLWGLWGFCAAWVRSVWAWEGSWGPAE